MKSISPIKSHNLVVKKAIDLMKEYSVNLYNSENL